LKKQMRVLVCGGRDYQDRVATFAALDEVNAIRPISLVIHGACCAKGNNTQLRGADRWAQEWAQEHEIPYFGVPARWSLHGNSAGMERNGRMLLLKPEAVIAMPGGAGTRNMITQARKAGIRVWDLQN
jgi:hypothetical protein